MWLLRWVFCVVVFAGLSEAKLLLRHMEELLSVLSTTDPSSHRGRTMVSSPVWPWRSLSALYPSPIFLVDKHLWLSTHVIFLATWLCEVCNLFSAHLFLLVLTILVSHHHQMVEFLLFLSTFFFTHSFSLNKQSVLDIKHQTVLWSVAGVKKLKLGCVGL